MPDHPQPRNFGIGLLAVLLGLSLGVGRATASREILPLKIRFWADEIEITGALPDQRTANRLLIAIHQAQPGKPIYNQLVIDTHRTVPDLPESDQLAGLLLELALSTVDGSLSVKSREVIVGGLTDSHVTHAAFRARLQSATESQQGRTFRNQICLVHPDDLDASLLPRRPRSVLAFRNLESVPVELEEERFGPVAPLPIATAVSLATLPLPANGSSPAMATSPSENEPPEENAKKNPKRKLEPTRRIEFTADSYLVSVRDYDSLDEVAAALKAHPKEHGKIVLRGHPDTEGRHTYNDWLSLSRAKAVQRILTDAGIPEDVLKLEISGGEGNPKNLRTVSIWVPRPIETDPRDQPTEVALQSAPESDESSPSDPAPNSDETSESQSGL